MIDTLFKRKPKLRIVLTAFFNQNYLEEAKICIESIKKNGDFKGKIDLITDIDITIPGVNVIITNDCKTMLESAGYRLKMLDLVKWKKTDLILYLDTDIVILRPMIDLNNFVSENKISVYGYPNRTQESDSFAGFLSKDPKIVNQKSFCSGILLFRPNNKIKALFTQTWDQFIRHINDGKETNGCWEQPFLGLEMAKNNMYNVSLNELVYEERSKEIDPNSPTFVSHSDKDTALFNHFCGLRGAKRKEMMSSYLEGQ